MVFRIVMVFFYYQVCTMLQKRTHLVQRLSNLFNYLMLLIRRHKSFLCANNQQIEVKPISNLRNYYKTRFRFERTALRPLTFWHFKVIRTDNDNQKGYKIILRSRNGLYCIPTPLIQQFSASLWFIYGLFNVYVLKIR